METPKIPPSEVITQPSAFTFATEKVQPPAYLYISKDDRIRLRTWNSTPGITITVHLRMLLPNGKIIPNQFAFNLDTTRIAFDNIIPTAEGYIIGILVGRSAGTPRRGQCYFTLFVDRGSSASAVGTQMLTRGYVTEASGVGWPYGRDIDSIEGPGALRSIVGTDPAAGVEISETVPTNARWRLIAFTANLVTSAVAGNRRVALVHDDGANIYSRAFATANIVVSTNIFITWADSYPAAANSDNQQMSPLPGRDILFQGFRLRTITAGLDPGDNWGPPTYLVEEWIEN